MELQRKVERKAGREAGGPALLRKLALALPEVEEGTSYGTPAWRVRKKLIARLREDDASAVVRVDFDAREILIEADPGVYSVTDHYLNYPMVVVRLSKVDPGELAELLEDAWRRLAPKRAIRAYDEG